MLRAGLIGMLHAVTLLAGCSLAAASPEPCAAVFSATRCEAMTVYAAAKLGIDPAEIAALDVLPEPTSEVRDGRVILPTIGGGQVVDVLVTLGSGSVFQVSMGCLGISLEAQCLDTPELRAVSPFLGGYRDIPCAGEPPAGCATPVPPPDAEGLAAATELLVARVDIAVDHVGDHEIPLGTARLPGGSLSEASFELVDRSPTGMVILDSRVTLDVRSLEPDGRPFSNVYDHGWRPGVENVEVVLRFHVDAVDTGGAVLSIRDVVVR